jgi:hypothetical protein
MFYNQMFSKIILAALCSTAVSGSAVYEKPVDFIEVIPGCANLFVSPQSFITAALIDEVNKATEDKPSEIDLGDRKLHWTFCTKDIKNPKKADESGSAFVVSGDKALAFTDAKFLPYAYNSTSKLYEGFTMTYTSKVEDPECHETGKKS